MSRFDYFTWERDQPVSPWRRVSGTEVCPVPVLTSLILTSDSLHQPPLL